MMFEEYVCRRKINITKLAAEIGYSRAHIQGVYDGRFPMGKKLAYILEEHSKGEMKAENLLDWKMKKRDPNFSGPLFFIEDKEKQE